MKDQSMRMYDARNVLREPLFQKDSAIQIYEPRLIKGRIIFMFSEVSRDRAVDYARLLWNAPAFQRIPAMMRADTINDRYIIGTEISMDEMRGKK